MPLGDGTNSDYPSALDTAQTFTNGASPGVDDSTRIDAELVNDILDALIKIESELGTSPAGLFSDVKTRLDYYLPVSGIGQFSGEVFFADTNGTLFTSTSFRFGNGLRLGNPIGGDKGSGTLNAQAVYDDNALLTCYVLEYINTGQIDFAKWDATIGPDRQHKRAREFLARAKRDLNIAEYVRFWRNQGHLPAMPSPEQWSSDQPGLGSLVQSLWETVEVQAAHIAKLHERLEALEAKSE